MVKKRLNRTQKLLFAEKALDFSLLSTGGLVFVQLFSEKDVSVWLVIIGIVLSVLGVIIAYWLTKGGD